MGFFSELYTHIKGEPKQYDYKFSNGVELIDKENSTQYIVPSIVNGGSSSINTFMNLDGVKQTDIKVRTKFFIHSDDIEYQYQYLHILSNHSENPIGYKNSDEINQYVIDVPDDAILCCSGFKNIRCNSNQSLNYHCSDMLVLKKDKFKSMMASLGTNRFFNFLPEREILKIPKSVSKYLDFQKDDQGFTTVCFQSDTPLVLNYDSIEKTMDYLLIMPSKLQANMDMLDDKELYDYTKSWIAKCIQRNEVHLDSAIKDLSNHNQPSSRKLKISLKPKAFVKKLKSIGKSNEEEHVR